MVNATGITKGPNEFCYKNGHGNSKVGVALIDNVIIHPLLIYSSIHVQLECKLVLCWGDSISTLTYITSESLGSLGFLAAGCRCNDVQCVVRTASCSFIYSAKVYG